MIVEIFSDEQLRGLRYIEAANLGGYQPTAAQVTEWVFRSDRRPAQRGRLIESAKPPAISTAISTHLADIMNGLRQPSVMENLSEFMRPPVQKIADFLLPSTSGPTSFSEQWMGTPARYGPGKPAETYIEHLIRMSWLAADEAGGLRLTPLGRALMRSDAFGRQDEDGPTVIVLEADSPLSYVQLVGHIAGCGAAFVIDPYVRAEHLWRLIQDTTTVRVLIGPLKSKNDQDLVELRQTLASSHRPIEVRRAAEGVLHDRFIVGDSGVVYSVGASWNGVGKHVTTIVQYPQAPIDRLVDIFEKWWEEALPVEPAAPFPTPPAIGGDIAGPASAESSPTVPPKRRRRRSTSTRSVGPDAQPPSTASDGGAEAGPLEE